ncbi:hypothetical protein CONLIGDRAFT_673906 [Coniochaeta ligniaria NRRL 30616]|uniref:Uncharacterized protein n=1 Tax=Coniochaeta ligniaria NRRL 30616 TaxID=1408157 RepID=A0A1J7I9S9_9PEZI|nr:hypothetical protein CONLIGDRAFT_673906 [Coniochaeta ligniaria NRRL 30616]
MIHQPNRLTISSIPSCPSTCLESYLSSFHQVSHLILSFPKMTSLPPQPSLHSQFTTLLTTTSPHRPIELVVWIPSPQTYFTLSPSHREPDLDDLYASAPPSSLPRHLVAPICRRVADMFEQAIQEIVEVAEQTPLPRHHEQHQVPRHHHHHPVPTVSTMVYDTSTTTRPKRDTLRDVLARGELRPPAQLRRKKSWSNHNHVQTTTTTRTTHHQPTPPHPPPPPIHHHPHQPAPTTSHLPFPPAPPPTPDATPSPVSVSSARQLSLVKPHHTQTTKRPRGTAVEALREAAAGIRGVPRGLRRRGQAGERERDKVVVVAVVPETETRDDDGGGGGGGGTEDNLIDLTRDDDEDEDGFGKRGGGSAGVGAELLRGREGDEGYIADDGFHTRDGIDTERSWDSGEGEGG